MINLRLPNITASAPQDQLQQMKSYLYQLTKDLEFALQSVQTNIETVAANDVGKTKKLTNEETQATFNAVKSLIIKSADIVNAYYQQISQKLEGQYVAQSDFGSYVQETNATITAASDSITQLYSNVQQITGEIDSLLEVTAAIQTGILYYDDDGFPVYGLQIGQTKVIDGEEVFNKYAMFSADRLSFYDANGTEIAYFSDYVLHIAKAEISGELTLGGYKLETDNGLTFKWVGE